MSRTPSLLDVRAGRRRIQLGIAREWSERAAVGIDVEALNQVPPADAKLLAAEGAGYNRHCADVALVAEFLGFSIAVVVMLTLGSAGGAEGAAVGRLLA